MSRILTPQDILQNVLEKKISKKEALKLLETLINESNKAEIRVEVIKTIEKLVIFNDSTFDILERCLLADESDNVRFSAARVLIENFDLNEDTPIFYAIENEQSIYFLKNLLNLNISEGKPIINDLKNAILNKISKFYNLNPADARFILDIDYMDYIKFKINFEEFVDKFHIEEGQKHDLLKENTRMGYKGLGRIVKTENGFITGLRLNDFEEIPNTIQFLSKLEYLEVKRSNLQNLDQSYENLLNLKYLILSNNEMDSIPIWVFEVANRGNYALKYIKFGVESSEAKILGLLEILLGQALVKLGEEESFNHSLLYYYKINYNGNIIGISISSDLNKIGIFPEQLCSLKFLKELCLPNQNLRKIPDCIIQLELLETFDLRNNKIKYLPDTIRTLKNLKNLLLKGNPLPKEFLKVNYNKKE